MQWQEARWHVEKAEIRVAGKINVLDPNYDSGDRQLDITCPTQKPPPVLTPVYVHIQCTVMYYIYIRYFTSRTSAGPPAL